MNPLLLGPLADIIKSVISRIWPDPAAQADAQLKLAVMVQNGELAQLAADTELAKAQISVNTVDAASGSLFVAGWRPFIGWVCGAGCAWNWLGLPIATLGLSIAGIKISVAPADLGQMMPLLLGMLGIGGLRTIEKIKGVA